MKVRTQVRRDAIIEMAASLFQECGYEGASMNELAKRLGGSKTTLYGYFPSKEALFTAVVRTFATVHLAEAASALPATVDDMAKLRSALLHFARQFLQVLANDAQAIALNRVVVAESGRSEVGELFYEAGPSECVTALTQLFGAAMDRGLLRRGDAQVRARQLLSLITTEISHRMYQRDPPPMALPAIRQIAKRAIDMFLGGAEARRPG
jgi:Transcriptional regulator